MRFAGQHYQAPGYRLSRYLAPSGSIGGYRAQSGSAGMEGVVNNFQAPTAQQIAFTQMPEARNAAHKAKSGAIGSFRAPVRV